MEQKFVLTSDQVRKFEKAFVRNDLQMRHFNWMLAGDNLRPVKWMADGEIALVVYRGKRDSEGRINLDTIKVGRGKGPGDRPADSPRGPFPIQSSLQGRRGFFLGHGRARRAGEMPDVTRGH
ncbi:MAG: hypothetical protein WDN67_05005 [Candidatus Moraniibacteriota bacterium]